MIFANCEVYGLGMPTNYYMMKIITVKKLLIFIAIILSFSLGPALAGDQPQQKTASQQLEQKNKNNVNKETKDNSKEKISTEKDKFDYSSLITLLGILVSASLIIWQLGRQHKNNIELQRENNREKLKLEIYTEYRKTISKASDKVGSAGTNARLIVTHFNIYVDQISKGITPMPISDREPAFRDSHFDAINSIVDLIFVLEEYEIINPNLEIFRTAFSYANHCMTKAFHPFQQVLLEFLPYDVPAQDQERLGTNIIIPKIPSKDDLSRISEVAHLYIDAAMEAGCFVSDLAKEAQNIFLGDLFSNRIPPRKPIDPKYIVISTAPEQVAGLKKYFLEETEWGKDQKRVEDKIRESVKNKNNP